MPLDQKLPFLIENLRDLPDELSEEGVEILKEAGEIEFAVVLARDKGLIETAIDILVEEGDYLWAALIAKNAGLEDESVRLYSEGLGYYIDMEMYGRAISAATALKLPQEEIDGLFMKGVEVESRTMDLDRTRDMLEYALGSLESAIIGRDDGLSKELTAALDQQHRKMEEDENRAS